MSILFNINIDWSTNCCSFNHLFTSVVCIYAVCMVCKSFSAPQKCFYLCEQTVAVPGLCVPGWSWAPPSWERSSGPDVRYWVGSPWNVVPVGASPGPVPLDPPAWSLSLRTPKPGHKMDEDRTGAIWNLHDNTDLQEEGNRDALFDMTHDVIWQPNVSLTFIWIDGRDYRHSLLTLQPVSICRCQSLNTFFFKYDCLSNRTGLCLLLFCSTFSLHI